MPARSCQCPERRTPIASRRWEICSKPGDGTAVICCKQCGAIWTTRAKFADAMPYDIGPVTLPKDAFQHTRAIVALTMLDALLYQFRPLVEDQPKVLRHLDKMREIIEACGNPSVNAGLLQAHNETSMQPAMLCTRATASLPIPRKK